MEILFVIPVTNTDNCLSIFFVSVVYVIEVEGMQRWIMLAVGTYAFSSISEINSYFLRVHSDKCFKCSSKLA